MTNGMFSALGVAVGAALVAIGAVLAPDAGFAQSSAKELMGKAQTKSNTQAVEDLIKKLQGPQAPEPAAAQPSTAPAPPTQEAAKPAETKPAEAASPAATPKAGEPKVAAPQPDTRPAAAEKKPSTPPATKEAKTSPPAPSEATPKTSGVSAEAAVEKADRNELASADLEVYFDYKSAAVTPQATEVLTTLGKALADGRLSGDKFLIAGHTDARGSAASNLALSQRRAESVRAFLIENFKIDAKKLEAKGFGKSKLKNQSDPNADENRRVQVINLSSAEARR